MAKIPPVSHILFLPGVYENDINSDDRMVDEKYTSDAIDIQIGSVHEEYSGSIPTVYTTHKHWIKSTGLKCWNCDRFFKNPPIFIVDDVSYIDGDRQITPHGNFCSDNCAIAYIDCFYKGTARDDKIKYQIMLARERTGKNITIIKPSPPKTCMRAYCGPSGITSEEYESKINELNSEYALIDYKIESLRTKF